MIDGITIRSFREGGDPVPAITGLLHDAYAPLAAMGLRYTATYQDDTVTLRRLKRGVPFVVERHGEIVATVTLYPDALAEGPCEWYRKPGVQHFGQFAVKPVLQGQGLGTRMIRFLENEAVKLGARELALDTAEPAHLLRSWYQRLGFRQVETVRWDQTNYTSVILSKPPTRAPCP